MNIQEIVLAIGMFTGIVLALVFIGMPFAVRTLQPVIEDIEPEIEEAAAISVSHAVLLLLVLGQTVCPSVPTLGLTRLCL